MTVQLLDTMLSLTALTEEESDMLSAPGLNPALRECSAAKVALVAALEARNVQLDREQPGWMAALDPEAREQMLAAIAALHDASVLNADVLRRQIDLSTEMMAAVAAEVQRQSGTGAATYGAHGELFPPAAATPISLNTRL